MINVDDDKLDNIGKGQNTLFLSCLHPFATEKTRGLFVCCMRVRVCCVVDGATGALRLGAAAY